VNARRSPLAADSPMAATASADSSVSGALT
jgi:hypothetical protein